MDYWKIEDQKTELTDIVMAANQNGPQIITKQGQQTAVVLSMSDYQKLKENAPLSEFFRRSPLAQSEIELDGDRK